MHSNHSEKTKELSVPAHQGPVADATDNRYGSTRHGTGITGEGGPLKSWLLCRLGGGGRPAVQDACGPWLQNPARECVSPGQALAHAQLRRLGHLAPACH